MRYFRGRFVNIKYAAFCSVFAAYMSVNTASATQPGENVLQASLDSELGYVDNFLYQNDNTESTSYSLIRPQLYVKSYFERSTIALNFDSSHYQYHNFSEDNHSNVRVNTEYQHRFSSNQGVYFKGGYVQSYELRGSGLSRGDALSLNEADDKRLISGNLGYIYGTNTSNANLDVNGDYLNSRYQSRRAETRKLDNEAYSLNASFDYLFSGRSFFSVATEYERRAYRNAKQLDQDKYTALAGFKWKTTQITQLSVLFGYNEIHFDDDVLANKSDFKWRVEVNWQPTELTTVIVKTERDFDQTNTLADSYREVERYKVNMVSKITDYFSISADIGYDKDEIVYQTGTEQENYISSELLMKYQRNEWVAFHFRYEFSDVDADNNNIDSQRNSVGIGIDVTI